MTAYGGYTDEMKDRLSDTDVESLFVGSTGADPTLSELLTEIQTFAEWTPDPDRQIADVVGAVAAVSRPVAEETELAGNQSHTRTRRNWMFGRIMSSRRLAKVMTGILVAVFATGGMAYAGVLPDPIQAAVSDVAQVVGLDIDDGAVDDVDDGAVDDLEEGQVGDTDDGADDDLEEGQVGDTDDGADDDLEEGQVGDTDDGADDDLEEGQVDDLDDESTEDYDDGATGNDDENDSGTTDQGDVDG